MANVLNRSGERKRILVSTLVVRMHRLQFAYDEGFVLLAVECLWVIKLIKP